MMCEGQFLDGAGLVDGGRRAGYLPLMLVLLPRVLVFLYRGRRESFLC